VSLSFRSAAGLELDLRTDRMLHCTTRPYSVPLFFIFIFLLILFIRGLGLEVRARRQTEIRLKITAKLMAKTT